MDNTGDKKFTMIRNVDFIADDEDDTEENIIHEHSSASEEDFDIVIGCIEDIIVEDEFQNMQEQFMEANYLTFEETDENKLEYTQLHLAYVNLLERHIEGELEKRLPEFSMAQFADQLATRKDELSGEVFEMLFTFSDFEAFKELMLDYRKMKEGTAPDLSLDFTVIPITPRGGPSDVEMMSPNASFNLNSSMDCEMASPRDGKPALL